MKRLANQTLTTAEAESKLIQLAEGASKAFQNAVDLYREASVLRAVGAFSRALFLHQISLEECAKIDMLGPWAVSMLVGQEPDLKKVRTALTSHKAKNYTNAYMLRATKPESDARRAKRWDQAIQAFEKQQADFHGQSNTAKNASLYTDIQNGAFVAPKDRITEAMVQEIAQTNEEFLGLAQTKAEMMARWNASPDTVRSLLKGFQDRLEELRSESRDPDEMMSVMMAELLSRASESGYAEKLVASRRRDAGTQR